MTLSNKSPFEFRLRLPKWLSFCCLLTALLLPTAASALQSSLPDFTTLVKKNYESVVNISISHQAEDEDP